jgi:hypothetical protein
MMNVYSHQGCGHYIGSYIVVVSPSGKEAARTIRQILNVNGLEDEALNITKFTTYQEQVIVEINGDY